MNASASLAWQYGGGVYIGGGTATFNSCEIYSNTADVRTCLCALNSCLYCSIAPLEEASGRMNASASLSGSLAAASTSKEAR